MQPSIYHEGLMVGGTPMSWTSTGSGMKTRSRLHDGYAEQTGQAGRNAFFTA